MKSEKGLGMVGLILLMIIIAALVAGAIFFIRVKVNDETVENRREDMLKISWKAADLLEKAKVAGVDPVYIGTKYNEIKDMDAFKKIREKEIIKPEEEEKYYVLSNIDLHKLKVENVKNKDDEYYLVNYETNEIIYSAGCRYEGKEEVFKLSDIKKSKEEVKEEKAEEPKQEEVVVEESAQ